ncbi:MAG: ferritin-like domain-containing protein [Sporomusaceae bacterium]|nr:ferritin-like domain-containing protein [Sporomusaceae bacterium]|eukprot:TRINITY_DN14098_c0_g1_i1.p1 TRINITY_DN14098_c0_g1~~TRINITY_DN14098_c0_g1_i1.p1  ORF type:complete len:114 (-),score=12.19 TRINITY_DN14098_c0_g1_i1:37-378(-)
MAYGQGKQDTSIQATKFEQLLIWLREDLIGEFEAINQYQLHIDNIDNEEIKDLLAHIRDDEKEHVAELMHIIARIDEIQKQKFLEDHTVGHDEKVVVSASAPADSEPTVGKLR